MSNQQVEAVAKTLAQVITFDDRNPINNLVIQTEQGLDINRNSPYAQAVFAEAARLTREPEADLINAADALALRMMANSIPKQPNVDHWGAKTQAAQQRYVGGRFHGPKPIKRGTGRYSQ
jgi:hypothetical protein